MLTGNCSSAPECLNMVLSMMFTLWILHHRVFPRWFIISQASSLCSSIMEGLEPSYDFITFQHEYWRFHTVSETSHKLCVSNKYLYPTHSISFIKPLNKSRLVLYIISTHQESMSSLLQQMDILTCILHNAVGSQLKYV